jgi:glyceraldehyde-3-phosphate dehydrogenase (NADP+)
MGITVNKKIQPLLLGGKWRETEKKFSVINPYNGETLAHVFQAGPAEIEEALRLAENAAPLMASMPSHRKAAILQKASDALLAKKEEIARTITLENGKPIGEARTEAERASLTFRVASEEAARGFNGEFMALDRNMASEGRWGITRRFPAGPVLGITPFNFPVNLVAHKIAPAIASGNPVIIKPASKTPLSALMLGEVLIDAGLPEGCLSVLPAGGKDMEPAIADPRIKVLSFTGSAAVGWGLKPLWDNCRQATAVG